MPTILFINGYRFFFYLNEHEPIHIHVSKGDSDARIVLVPEIDITYCRGFKKNELKAIIEIIFTNYDKIIEEWQKAFDK
jgi:hypothetical protein